MRFYQQYKLNIYSVILFLMLYSCAQQKPLTGGDKDINPPKEKESNPSNLSTNFNETKVVIEFDEFIQLRNLKSQLIVSPLMNPEPKIMVKGKKLVITLPDSLSPNTTYSINFGEAISDITEFNPFLNYKYVFSTGSFLDSLSYSGTVVNAEDLTPQKEIFVLLYENATDSTPYLEKPKYVALTDKEGHYEITNIATGDYKIFALKDINHNYLFDLPNEEIAFKKELISLNESSTDNRLELFEEDNQLQYVKKSSYKNYGEFKIEFNKPVANFKVSLLDSKLQSSSFLFEGNISQTNFTCWTTDLDSLKKVQLIFYDGKEIIDTVKFKRSSKIIFSDTISKVSTNVSASFDLNKNIIIALKRPFLSYEPDSILFYEDSVLVSAVFSETSLKEFELAYDFKENTNYQLFIPPGTFTDIYGLQNDTIFKQFKTKENSDYGIINLNLTPNFTDNYILQLYRGNNLIDEQFFTGTQNISYNFLTPGDYEFKMILDKNNNKKWDTGKYLENVQPEEVIYYEKPIKIRANWDNDIIWTIIE